MLETIREYAADRLVESGEREKVARRHAEFFLALAEEAEPHLTSADQLVWTEGLQREMDNMRAVLAWTVETREAEMGFRLGAALWRFWQFRGHLEEGRVDLERLLALPEGGGRTTARARGLNATGSIVYWQADYVRARATYEEALDIFRELDDPAGMAEVLYNLGYVENIEHNYELALTYYNESRDLARATGDRKLEAYTSLGLALASQLSGRAEETLAIVKEGLPMLEELGEMWGMANLQGVAARVLTRRGRFDEARASLRQCLELLRDAGDVPGIAWAIDDAANLELAEGHPERAIPLAGAAEAFREALGARAPVALTEYEDPRPKVRDQMDEAAIEEAWNQGMAMTVEEAVAYALAEERAPAK
jgi:tetratricopeptide (TPR) repeat protein